MAFADKENEWYFSPLLTKPWVRLPLFLTALWSETKGIVKQSADEVVEGRKNKKWWEKQERNWAAVGDEIGEVGADCQAAIKTLLWRKIRERNGWEEAAERINPEAKSRGMWWRWSVRVSVCLCLCVVCVWALCGIWNIGKLHVTVFQSAVVKPCWGCRVREACDSSCSWDCTLCVGVWARPCFSCVSLSLMCIGNLVSENFTFVYSQFHIPTTLVVPKISRRFFR